MPDLVYKGKPLRECSRIDLIECVELMYDDLEYARTSLAQLLATEQKLERGVSRGYTRLKAPIHEETKS